MKITRILNNIFQERKGLIELLTVAIVMGLAINIIAGSFLSLVNIDDKYDLLIGVILLILAIGYFLFKIYMLQSTSYKIDGWLMYHKEKKVLLPAMGYDYLDTVAKDLLSAFKENEAIKKQWENEPLEDVFKVINKEHKYINPRSHQLVRQLTEYYFLKKLSNHLSEHFNDDKFQKEKLTEFNRRDIPNVLFDNCFLELFSKPMEERPAFVDEVLQDREHMGIVVAAFRDGVQYEQFNLILPKKAKVRKTKGNELEICTPRFNLKFKINFMGMNISSPSGYKRFYLGIEDKLSDIRDLDISVELTVDFNLMTFFTTSGWEYFTWIDTFIQSFHENFSKDYFFKKINWETVGTITRVLYHMNKKEEEKKLTEYEEVDVNDEEEKEENEK